MVFYIKTGSLLFCTDVIREERFERRSRANSIFLLFKKIPGLVEFYDEDLSTFVSAILQEEEVKRENPSPFLNC